MRVGAVVIGVSTASDIVEENERVNDFWKEKMWGTTKTIQGFYSFKRTAHVGICAVRRGYVQSDTCVVHRPWDEKFLLPLGTGLREPDFNFLQ
jgi:hypothetical protein